MSRVVDQEFGSYRLSLRVLLEIEVRLQRVGEATPPATSLADHQGRLRSCLVDDSVGFFTQDLYLIINRTGIP